MPRKMFLYGQDANGNLVHIDEVTGGLKCNCTCPVCGAPLMARKGEVREHHFAHHGDRAQHHEKCYIVVLFKIAEKTILENKKLFVPSYHHIFKEGLISFSKVEIDSRYDRDDKQPDVIATTEDGTSYLIEFTYRNQVERNKKIDLNTLNYLEIDLSNQTHDSIIDFLLKSSLDRIWLNNQSYFDLIEAKYKAKNLNVRLVEDTECRNCRFKSRSECCAVTIPKTMSILDIHNNGHVYRLCKPEEYDKLKANSIISSEAFDAFPDCNSDSQNPNLEKDRQKELETLHRREYIMSLPIEKRTCFMCRRNRNTNSNDSIAYCRDITRPVHAETAKYCPDFIAK